MVKFTGIVQSFILATAFWVLSGHRLPLQAQDGFIQTIAGTGDFSFSGDNGPAISATLGNPEAVFVDALGQVYIADTGNNRVRKVDVNGIITTVAGNGLPGPPLFGDGGVATDATVSGPHGLFVDREGTLFIAENFGIRKVDANGIITTVAGNGFFDFGGDGGPATEASLSFPEGVFVDEMGNLFIADTGNCHIRNVDTNGIITTVAGNVEQLPCLFLGDGVPATTTSLGNPESVFVDSLGHILIADTDNCLIRRVDPNGIITTVAGIGAVGTSRGNCSYTGEGPAMAVTFNLPSSLVADRLGQIWIADTENHRIRKIDTVGVTSTVAGTGVSGSRGDGGPATSAELNSPEGVFVDDLGQVWIADTLNNRIRVIGVGPAGPSTAGIITTVAGTGEVPRSGDGGPALAAGVGMPESVFVDRSGNLFVVSNQCWVRRVDATGAISIFAGTTDPFVLSPCGYNGDLIPATEAFLNFAMDIFIDASGNLFIADFANQRIRKVTPFGIITTVAGNGSFGPSGDGGLATQAALGSPVAVYVDAAGTLFFSEFAYSRIRRVDATGIITTVAGNGMFGFSGEGGLATQAALFAPEGLYGDGSGNLFIADTGNHRIRRVDPSGIITTVAGSGQASFFGDGGPAVDADLNTPTGLVVDGAGNLYVADTTNDRIRKIDPQGIITTVAGAGARDFFGDGGPATAAALNLPRDVFVDGAGNLFIADTQNHRVRHVRFEPAGPTESPAQ